MYDTVQTPIQSWRLCRRPFVNNLSHFIKTIGVILLYRKTKNFTRNTGANTNRGGTLYRLSTTSSTILLSLDTEKLWAWLCSLWTKTLIVSQQTTVSKFWTVVVKSMFANRVTVLLTTVDTLAPGIVKYPNISRLSSVSFVGRLYRTSTNMYDR